ncbi:DUF4132 domain-containing protein [Microtetraspora sp. AC03309]|uniref:DUF4132 domain-containing protein n=1 Tax=Microtetraspora sp. AC03309 TaxID=2779376 RepID=UPI001E5C3B47|nr:DUF4132 domain-containing protein [Microtetraspora sp. AC03309]MCC5575959.1 DUF4132 domain-containing protein [Microtetraspora sp. AC03309]
MRLSPSAQLLYTVMTDPSTDNPDPWPHSSQLTAFDLGTLLPVAYRTTKIVGTAMSARFAVESAAKERRTSFTPEACADLFQALVDGLEARNWSNLPLAVASLPRCPGGPPLADLTESARTLVRFHLRAERTGDAYALLAVAGIAGLDDEVTAVLKEGRGPIALDEIDLLLGWDAERRALLVEALQERSYTSLPPLPDTWERLAAIPEYVAFARTALEAAEARIAAIHAREIPYRADRAFDDAEKEALGRAVRLALWRDEPWLPGLLDRLLRGVAVAPTAAKTLPSQGLLFEIGRAVEDFPTPEAISALRTARALTRHAGVPKQLDRMLKRIEHALADRVEVAFRMPDLGFEPGGRLRVPLGEHTAMISIGDDVELTWWQGEKRFKAAPAAVRRDHPDEVKRLRELTGQVRRQLTTLVRALEAGYPGDARHPYATWRERMAEHPIAGTVARRLVWEIEVSPGHWRSTLGDTGITGTTGTTGPEPPPDAPVRLWHPARAPLDEVRAWRERITGERVRQPFKQAFREVYLLTPAEEETGVYSNRFAAHVVDYRTLYALFKQRAWSADLLGPWDGGGDGEARRVLAGGRWRASFFHESLGGDHAVTDQVRFHRNADGEWRRAALAEVPPLVFSEAMRDVDLFVAVTSIAADPGWADRGTERHYDYWRTAAFGALPPSAEVRRDALARLLPRTAIADRCTLTDRYLVVRGDLRTYKIHLGSANILMDPGDVYLCIVSAPGSEAERVFLPFEEDGRLALILSKAFLLARDGEIGDESIIRQIKG